MAITFRYKKIERPEKYLPSYAPAIPVTLGGSKDSIDVIGLLDSGADISAISRNLADLLGVDISGKEEGIGGIGGSARAVLSKLTVKIGKGHEMYTFQMSIYVVLDEMEDDFPVLIGRKDFFEKFKITFDESSKKLSLKKV